MVIISREKKREIKLCFERIGNMILWIIWRILRFVSGNENVFKTTEADIYIKQFFKAPVNHCIPTVAGVPHNYNDTSCINTAAPFVKDLFEFFIFRYCFFVKQDSDNRIWGPYFFKENFTVEWYLYFLRYQMVPWCLGACSNCCFQRNGSRYLQDGSPLHIGIKVREYLDEMFAGGWPERRGTIE